MHQYLALVFIQYFIIWISHILFIRRWPFGWFLPFQLLWIMPLWTFIYKFLCRHMFSCLLGVYLGLELLSQVVALCFKFLRNCQSAKRGGYLAPLCTWGLPPQVWGDRDNSNNENGSRGQFGVFSFILLAVTPQELRGPPSSPSWESGGRAPLGPSRLLVTGTCHLGTQPLAWGPVFGAETWVPALREPLPPRGALLPPHLAHEPKAVRAHMLPGVCPKFQMPGDAA